MVRVFMGILLGVGVESGVGTQRGPWILPGRSIDRPGRLSQRAASSAANSTAEAL